MRFGAWIMRRVIAPIQNDRGVKCEKQKDYAKATRWYRMAAEKWDFLAQYNLGIMCANGLGVPQD